MTNVARFPPLPPVTETPPRGPLDPRQETYYHVIGTIGRAIVEQQGGTVAESATVTGYRAAAVDVGHLQEILEAGLRLFDMNDVRERWEIDVFDWCLTALRGWVQRRKHLKLDLAENGIRVFMETQDDRGYYTYEFDVFPGKGRPRER